MNIIIGHSNTDLDCLGSIVLAKYLYPGYVPVKSRLIHPVAKKAENLFQNNFNFINPKDLQNEHVENIVIVDTRTYSRVKEYFQYIGNDDAHIEVYDHHPGDENGFPEAEIHYSPTGSNTTQLGVEVMKQVLDISPEDASIALAGIYADTGNFTHENVGEADFSVASFLLKSGADLNIVKTILTPLAAKYQITLFHELLNRLEYCTIHGHRVITSYWEIENEAEGLGAVVEKVFEVENQDVYFALFHFKKKNKTLIIARNQKRNIHLNEILKDFGGGGHEKAASATVKNQDGQMVYAKLLAHLDRLLTPAVTAAEIMTREVDHIHLDASLLEASLYMEKISHTGLPVLGEDHNLVGFITLRDIMKGRRAEQMHAPVKAYMSRNIITAPPDTTVWRIEELLFNHNIGHLPIVEESQMVGIVTRADYLDHKRSRNTSRQAVLQDMGLEVKEPVGSY
ncbi:MAG: CBS domain-containing protein [Sediminispirochaetaceae bacterium]